MQLSLGEMTGSDSTDAHAKMKNIEENDLIIRDLGYTTIKAMKETSEAGAYYINRMNDANMYEKVDDEYKRLTIKEIAHCSLSIANY